jgi:hypothetical protein
LAAGHVGTKYKSASFGSATAPQRLDVASRQSTIMANEYWFVSNSSNMPSWQGAPKICVTFAVCSSFHGMS